MSKLIFTVITVLWITTSGHAQISRFNIPPVDWSSGWVAGIKVSTTGPGFEAIKSVNQNWNARLGFSLLPLSLSPKLGNKNLQLSTLAHLRTGGINGQADFFLNEWYYFTAGLWANLLKADFNFQLQAPVEYGEITISPEQIGELDVAIKPGWLINPYLGIGFGNPMPQNRKFWFNIELGCWYQHKPDFSLAAHGMIRPTVSAENEKALENHFKGYRFFPVFSIQGNYKIF